MAENGSLHASKSKWKMPLLVFFKDARLVFKMDSLTKEILWIAFPAALAVAADPLASLIDTAFIGHLGPVELAAAGASIALFNLTLKITIAPLVSITTSFVAEEDAIEKINTIVAEERFIKNVKAKSNDVRSDDHLPQDIKIKENCETTTESFAANGEINELMASNDTNTNICKSSVVTSSNKSMSKSGRKRRHLASASTALLFGTILGLLQAVTLIFGAKPLLAAMGLKHGSPMLVPAIKYLRLRALGSPAVLLSLVMQGIFRGFKDTTTPLFVIASGYALNVALDPILIFSYKLGIQGAAISHVLSQYLMALALLVILMRKMVFLPPGIANLQIFRFLKNGGLVLVRIVSITFFVTLAASLAARLGAIPMAAFQPCLQVWLTSSLLADGLAIGVQAILASSFAEKDYEKVIAAAARTLQLGLVLGVGLSLVVGVGLYFGARIFSKNDLVVNLIRIVVPFVATTQPFNTLAFIFDGVYAGASDFAYSAYSLVMVALVSVAPLFLLYKRYGFVGIWTGLTINMTLRMFAGVFRMGTGTGPWRFLRGRSLS